MSAEDLIIRWGNLEKFYEELEKVGGQAADVETYAREQVFNRSGFDYPLCVLKPLADAMDTMGDVFGDLRTTFDSRWVDLVSALESTAADARRADEAQEFAYRQPIKDMRGAI